MKLGPVTKLDKRNTATSKQFDDNVTSANCGAMVNFPIYDQFKYSGSGIPYTRSVKLSFSLIGTFYLTKAGNRTKTNQTQLSYNCFE